MENDITWRFCISGNIVNNHIDQDGLLRYGTKAFTGGTKVYLNGKSLEKGNKTIEVIGRNRFGRFVADFIPIDYIENIRIQRVYKPVVLKIISYLEAVEGDQWWGYTPADRKESEQFVMIIRKQNLE